ncbi:MAG: sugar phosphate isomerase/epimerase family protein [bacterium]|nr:sugar phosphate isomerase/epimerase family protein [bacterium]
MRFGVNTWVWASPLTTDELKRLAPLVQGMGFDWIELPLEGLDDFDHAEAGKIVRDHGLGVSVCAAMGPDRDLIHEDAAIRENGAFYVRQCVDAMNKIGGTNIVGPLYSAVGRVWQQTADERARDLDTLVGQLSALAQYAGDHGTVLCLEPLNRFETSFINTADQAIEVVDRVNHPALKIMLDTFHMNIEEKSLGDAIRRTGARLAHVHTCENDRGAPGSGNVTWNEVAAALREIGYDGPLVIESFTNKVKSIARAAAIWRAFEPSQDALAENGVKFLKQLFAA